MRWKMDKNKLIMTVLVIIILILAVALFATNYHAKDDVKLNIISNSTLHEGDYIKVKLTDLNNTHITNQTINITITDENDTSSYYSTVTNNKGIATLKLDKFEGNYTVNCTFDGDENYNGNSTSKKITIEKDVVEAQANNSYSSYSGSSQSSDSNSGYGTYLNGEWHPMTEQEYAERYPALYHTEMLEKGKYDQYHPEFYDVDRQNGYI